jgi:hypothetical protein
VCFVIPCLLLLHEIGNGVAASLHPKLLLASEWIGGPQAGTEPTSCSLGFSHICFPISHGVVAGRECYSEHIFNMFDGNRDFPQGILDGNRVNVLAIERDCPHGKTRLPCSSQ